MELTENEQLKRTIGKLTLDIGNSRAHAAAAESLAEMLNEKLTEVQQELDELKGQDSATSEKTTK
jgi:predicted  nucleic acid-binding Zn-ribbon protein